MWPAPGSQQSPERAKLGHWAVIRGKSALPRLADEKGHRALSAPCHSQGLKQLAELIQFVTSICINESNSIEYTPTHRIGTAVAYSLISPVEPELLTVRQLEVFDLIVIGQSNKEIARRLGLSEGTVKIHIAKLFDKLGVRHRSAVALAGGKLGIRPSPTRAW